MTRWRLSSVLAFACFAISPSVSAAQAGYRSGNVTGDPSAVASNLPIVDASGSSKFNADLDLPDLPRYQREVLRFIQGGRGTHLVVQFAVVENGKPVQVMALLASPRPPWTLRSPRRFGWLSWSDYLGLRSKVLPAIMTAPPEPGSSMPEICLDGGGGEIGYSAHVPDSPTVLFSVGCKPAGRSQAAVATMVDEAKRALGLDFPAGSKF